MAQYQITIDTDEMQQLFSQSHLRCGRYFRHEEGGKKVRTEGLEGVWGIEWDFLGVITEALSILSDT